MLHQPCQGELLRVHPMAYHEVELVLKVTALKVGDEMQSRVRMMPLYLMTYRDAVAVGCGES